MEDIIEKKKKLASALDLTAPGTAVSRPRPVEGELVASIKNLHLKYNLSFYKEQSLRDVFVNVVRHPVETLMAEKESLHVLNDINFEIHEGDVIGIVGGNGAGKTSLCRCLAGMLVPTMGNINVHGEVKSIFNTSVGIVPMLTGRENADLLATLLFPEMDLDERKKIVQEALEFSELGPFLDVPYQNYSKGMQTRLFLPIVSAQSCDLLILDEVFDGADEYFRNKISKRIINTIEKSGAVVFVSHSFDQIKTVCNRVIVLDHSKIVFDGDVIGGLDVYKRIIKTKSK